MSKLIQLKDADGNVVYPDISGLLITEKRTYEFGGVTIPVGAKIGYFFQVDVSKTGYKPLGVLGIFGSGSSGLSYSDWYFDTSSTIRVYYANNSNTDNYLYRLSVIVLYLRVS